MKEFIKKVIYLVLPFLIIRKGKKSGIYITFDDGPHPYNTLKIIKTLRNNNAKATFFMVGSDMEKYPDVVKAVLEEGHAIGYHSYKHHSLKQIGFKQIKDDFNKSRKLEKKFNFKFELYRPPYGDLTILGLLLLYLYNFKVVMWSVDSMDSFESKANVINNVSYNNVVAGDILLFHDDYDLTVEALPQILNNYSKYGLKCQLLR